MHHELSLSERAVSQFFLILPRIKGKLHANSRSVIFEPNDYKQPLVKIRYNHGFAIQTYLFKDLTEMLKNQDQENGSNNLFQPQLEKSEFSSKNAEFQEGIKLNKAGQAIKDLSPSFLCDVFHTIYQILGSCDLLRVHCTQIYEHPRQPRGPFEQIADQGQYWINMSTLSKMDTQNECFLFGMSLKESPKNFVNIINQDVKNRIYLS